jgi:DNA polymerase III subunit epsilon
MTLLKEESFVCLDCETTGLDTNKDRIIEIGVCHFSFSEVINSFETLVDPEKTIPPESILIHNISDNMVSGKPKIKDVLDHVFSITNGYTIIGHNIDFDLNVINTEAKRCGYGRQLDTTNTIDTVRLARLFAQTETNSLECLRKYFGIDELGAHRAMADVLVNIEVFKKLCFDYKSKKQIQNILKDPIQMKTMPLGKHKGKPFKDVPFSYLTWAKHQNFDRDLLFSIEQEMKKRKRRERFEDAANPFKDLTL